MAQNNWFEVDKDGLKEMFANFPEERMVAELVQNSWDTDAATVCRVGISEVDKKTMVSVEDDHPEGFKNLCDAYTLFRSTEKRSDPTKRGRFNIGEKIVFARALYGAVETTKGTIEFNKDGRHDRPRKKRKAGSRVSVFFPKWKKETHERVNEFLTKLYVPKGMAFFVGENPVKYQRPMKTVKTSLATEFLKTNGDGTQVMRRTQRKTEIWFYPKRFESAYLYEMGIPVCEIDGRFDANVQQKIPLSHDRTLVPQSYLQDIYAEMLVALGDLIEPGDLGEAHIQTAMEDERVDPDTCVRVFKQQFGENAVITNPFDADSNQEAARSGASLVNPRTFGAAINNKLRSGGIQTTTEQFCRNKEILQDGMKLGLPGGYKDVKDTDARIKLREYVQMLSQHFYGRKINVNFAQWTGTSTVALYNHGSGITFNVMRLTRNLMERPVSRCTSICLHELAHCMGQGHDGVYDQEFERLIDQHTQLLAKQPKLYKQYEPELFNA
jgi:hypothetical protein